MILGVGIDLIEVARIEGSYQKYGDRFLRRVLREPEIEYCFSHRNPAPFLAARFAAKEAISKAFGTGIGRQLGWQDMEVGRKASGQPYVILHDNAQKLMEKMGGQQFHLSLSHTLHYATAVAVLEGSG